jgi:hypothetical protein
LTYTRTVRKCALLRSAKLLFFVSGASQIV